MQDCGRLLIASVLLVETIEIIISSHFRDRGEIGDLLPWKLWTVGKRLNVEAGQTWCEIWGLPLTSCVIWTSQLTPLIVLTMGPLCVNGILGPTLPWVIVKFPPLKN